MKPKKHKPAATSKEVSQAHTIKAAAQIVGARIEALQMAKEAGCGAFRANGSVHIQELKDFLKGHPEILKATKELPDFKLEKTLKMRAERKHAELEYSKAIGDVVSMTIVKPLIMGLAKMVRAKLRQIPDRCSQKYSLMTDALGIKEDLRSEIDAALRAMESFKVEDFKKETLNEAA